MNKILFAALLLISFTATSQTRRDSIKYYEEKLRELSKRYQDSIRLNPLFGELSNNINRLAAESDDYRGVIMYFQSASADFTRMNQELSSAGFPTLSGNFSAVGVGYTSKKNQRLFDLYFLPIGFHKVSKKDGEKMRTMSATLLDFLWGYDMVKNKRVNIYPYAGIGLRMTDIHYKAEPTLNPSATFFRNIVVNDPSVTDNVTTINYHAGLGVEFILTSPEKAGGTLVFLKAGTNRAFREKEHEFEGVKFDPAYKAGELLFTAGFKFFGRR